ncbi:uncharacterized protein METZ01_LOCUS195251, partial [marine metagenome]
VGIEPSNSCSRHWQARCEISSDACHPLRVANCVNSISAET